MKKSFLIAAVAMFASATLFSCKKDYTCKCTITPTGGGPVQTVEVKMDKQKKKDAENACKAATTTYSNIGSASCSI